MGKRFASFYRCSAFERFWKVDHLLNVNISMAVGRIFTKIYIFISLSWAFFKNRKTLAPGQNDDPVTRT